MPLLNSENENGIVIADETKFRCTKLGVESMILLAGVAFVRRESVEVFAKAHSILDRRGEGLASASMSLDASLCVVPVRE